MREVKDIPDQSCSQFYSQSQHGFLDGFLQRNDAFFEAENVRDIHENYSSIAKNSIIASMLWNGGKDRSRYRSRDRVRDDSGMYPMMPGKPQPHVFQEESFFLGAYLEEQREYSELTCVTNSIWLPRVNRNYVSIDNVIVGNFRQPIKRVLFEAIEFDLMDPGREYHPSGRIPAVLVYRSSEEYDDEMTRALSQVLSSSPADTFHVEFQAMDPDYTLRYNGKGRRDRKLLILDIERNSDYEPGAPASPMEKLVLAR